MRIAERLDLPVLDRRDLYYASLLKDVGCSSNAARVYELIGELARECGCSALIVSHDQASTEIADRVVHIRDGRLAAESGPSGNGASIVVGRGGWLHLPEELLLQAGRFGPGVNRKLCDRVAGMNVSDFFVALCPGALTVGKPVGGGDGRNQQPWN